MTLTYIDLFAGCGGLSEGFHKNPKYQFVAAIEWEKAPVNTLVHRLTTKWHEPDAQQKVLRFDIQRTAELFTGWQDDPLYGSHTGLDSLVCNRPVDLIIGGPPCQAYSMAGRSQYSKHLKNDYRNYLFESYVKVVDRYRPKLFIFENVLGMLSAKPKDVLVTDLIRNEFDKHGYAIISDLKAYALQDLSDFGVPQTRKRLIIVGIRKDLVPDSEKMLVHFYKDILPKYHLPKKTVFEVLGDLPKFYPTSEYKIGSKRYSHSPSGTPVNAHFPRYHNKVDIGIFKMLAQDIESGQNLYVSSDKLKEVYAQYRGKQSSIPKYHVLRKDRPSHTITAHLRKDGLLYIHYDSTQARSLTVREAARLQTFDDDFDFIASAGENYKMIGNAVPPLFAERLSLALLDLFEKL